MRKFAVGVLVGVTVAMLLMVALAIGSGFSGSDDEVRMVRGVTIAATLILAPGLVFLALRRQVLLVLLAALVMFVLSFLYWYGDYGPPPPHLLGTLAGSLTVAGGTFHDLFSKQQTRSGRLLAAWAAVVSIVLSFLAWDAVKSLFEYLRPELLGLIAASLIAAVALVADLAHSASPSDVGNVPTRHPPKGGGLTMVIALAVARLLG